MDESSVKEPVLWLRTFRKFCWLAIVAVTLIIPAAYYGSGETERTMRSLSSLMAWAWFGIAPLFVAAHVSLIGTLICFKRQPLKQNLYGLFYPYFNLAVALIIGVAVGYFFWNG